uniref:Uncharacterized protein n=1 Tax=Panagrellus redivivus TaxID=6233 RepID=A0A7E4UW92_PANRE
MMPLAVALLVAWALPIAATLILVLVGCKKKKKEVKSAKQASTPSKSSNPEKSKGPGDSSAANKDKDNDNPKSVLAPRSFKPDNKEELEAMQNIKGGKVRAAKDNETVDDAASDWGNVKSMMDKENEKEEKKKGGK